MKKLAVIIILFFYSVVDGQNHDSIGTLQPREPLPSAAQEQQLENITENNADIETEDDSYLQEMIHFQKHPVDLNTADESLLKELLVLTPMQVQNFIVYRALLGKLISIYELQAVPGWSLETIHKIEAYVRTGSTVNLSQNIRQRFKHGEHTFLLRESQTLERSKGYMHDSSISSNFYAGSPQKILVRYKYQFKSLLQYGLLGEKDAGEQFFRGYERRGFDFYSFHLFARNMGLVKSMALGDYTVNLGQGLIQWQSLANNKGPDVLALKRESSVLRPYNSAGEINFHRGIGVTLGKNNWELTVFGSYRNVDANFISDTSIVSGDYVSSFQSSGYHRTKSEVADRGIQRQLAFGANGSMQMKRFHLGVNAIRFFMKYPLHKDPLPYNSFALSGKIFGNYSIDYNYTFRNMHFFGETAFYSKVKFATVDGLLISVAANIDMSLLYRNIGRGYQSLYSNAFTESSSNSTEKGLFAGIAIRPGTEWQINAFADIYKFPWLRYRVDAPSAGSDYSVTVVYKPTKQLEVFTSFKRKSQAINYNDSEFVLNPVTDQLTQNWTVNLSYRLSSRFTLRNRIEERWFNKKGPGAEEGYLIFVDLFYKPLRKRIAANIRLAYFETAGYNSRLYGLESDVLYNYSIPVLYGNGYRYYCNINYQFKKRISFWAKWIETIYEGQSIIGSGLDEIKGNKKLELRVQLVYSF